uniref:Mitochondrial pyruvate carrier n=1 Tax=Aegilops tauschii subsp. strangulata TaxID=200361 RepID=A0A453QBC9_AEGTS
LILLQHNIISSSNYLPLLHSCLSAVSAPATLLLTSLSVLLIRRVVRKYRKRVCRLDRMASSKLQAFWNHPAGPKTIHFWAPTFKWGISIANVADFAKPHEKISYPQQVVIACTGIIWSRYSMVITPERLLLGCGKGGRCCITGTGSIATATDST